MFSRQQVKEIEGQAFRIPCSLRVHGRGSSLRSVSLVNPLQRETLRPREENTGVWSLVLLTVKASTRSSDPVPKEFLFFPLGPP